MVHILNIFHILYMFGAILATNFMFWFLNKHHWCSGLAITKQENEPFWGEIRETPNNRI